MECTLKKNLNHCSCTYPTCSRKGHCCECVMYHRSQGELPACFFSDKEEATFDRSVQTFVRNRS